MRNPNSDLYVVRDKTAMEVGDIFHAKNDAVAIRQYEHMFQNAPHAKRTDYQLLKIGSMNHEALNILIYEEAKDITPELVSADGQHPCEV